MSLHIKFHVSTTKFRTPTHFEFELIFWAVTRAIWHPVYSVPLHAKEHNRLSLTMKTRWLTSPYAQGRERNKTPIQIRSRTTSWIVLRGAYWARKLKGHFHTRNKRRRRAHRKSLFRGARVGGVNGEGSGSQKSLFAPTRRDAGVGRVRKELFSGLKAARKQWAGPD